jgi:lambda family phage portal protein
MIAPKKQNFWARAKQAGSILFNRAYGYDAAKNTRRRGRRQDTHVRPEHDALDMADRQRVIATLLNFRRNDPLVASICRLRETDVVGPGLMPQAQSGNEELDLQLESLWATWSRHPEVTRQMNMRELQQQIAAMPLIFGDGGLLLTNNGQVQLIEGDRIGTESDNNTLFSYSASTGRQEDNPNKRVIEGVELNKQGMPIAYHIGKRVDGSLRDVRRITAKNFIFHKKRIRPDQVRGVPELATCADAIQDLAEYDSIEMLSAKVSASLSAVIRREGAMDFELAARANDDEEDRLEHMHPGQFQYLEPGEDVSVISANGRPNVDGIEYCTYRLRKVGASLGIPVEFLLMTIGDSSFSASQGMILLYQQTVESEQRDLFPVMDRLWNWKVRNWAAHDLIQWDNQFENPFNVRWQPPSFRWVNRAAQVKADMSYLNMGAISLDDVAATFGSDAASVLERKAKNIKTAKRLAEEYDVKEWRDLFNPIATTAQLNLVDLFETKIDE